MTAMMAIMKSELIVTMRTVIWRPCRQIEFDFVLMFDLPNPLTIVKWVDDAIETWSNSLALLGCCEGWDVWVSTTAAAVSSTSITWWSLEDLFRYDFCWVQSFCLVCKRLSWSFVNFSRFCTLNKRDEALYFKFPFTNWYTFQYCV